ncbi:MAG: hypothetical protein L0K74_00660 [Acidipropionibacterium acidipropionici]|nr:hypothetical protein [Acidipropionibacterium acidipropionici]
MPTARATILFTAVSREPRAELTASCFAARVSSEARHFWVSTGAALETALDAEGADSDEDGDEGDGDDVDATAAVDALGVVDATAEVEATASHAVVVVLSWVLNAAHAESKPL